METDGRQYQAINRAALTECEARLEARDREIERLRQRERQLYDALWTLDGHARLYMTLAQNVDEQTREALATPPPEGEPDDRVEAAYWDGRSDERKRWEPVQAHGDALAALEALADVAWNNVESHENRYVIHHSYDLVRRHLTASGVPEEVRRLPEKFRATGSRHGRFYANWLERALASAPADGYKLVPVEPTPKMVDATWDHDEDETESHNTRNHRIWSAMIAAAPADGRE